MKARKDDPTTATPTTATPTTATPTTATPTSATPTTADPAKADPAKDFEASKTDYNTKLAAEATELANYLAAVLSKPDAPKDA